MLPVLRSSAPIYADLTLHVRRIIRFVSLPIVLILFAISGQAQDGQYRLVAKANRPAVQVDGNTQIELAISGLRVSNLTKTPGDGLDAGREVLLRGNIGYSPKTPGIKTIGPFEFEFQGQWIRSGIVIVEAVPGWARGEEGYQFQVFPRILVKGDPIRVTFRQQYSGEPLVDMQSRSLQSTFRMTRKPTGEQVIEAQGPPKSWTSVGSSGTHFEGRTLRMTTWSFDIPTPNAGKMSITKNDLPPLPENIVFEPVEVEVMETKAFVPQDPGEKNSRPVGPSGAHLTLRMQPRTIRLGENLHLTFILNGVKVADLGDKPLPEAPQPYEWSREISFSDDLEFTPETSGEKTYGPAAVAFQGERILSNSQTVEVLPGWPRDAERYEFRIFPRKVVMGEPVRVTLRQQYSAKPYLEIPYNNPRSQNPNFWSAPGTQSWLENGRKYTRTVTTFEIPSTKVGKRIITRDDLPSMDASISFPPVEVEVIEAK